jgi:hypothetical protein
MRLRLDRSGGIDRSEYRHVESVAVHTMERGYPRVRAATRFGGCSRTAQLASARSQCSMLAVRAAFLQESDAHRDLFVTMSG